MVGDRGFEPKNRPSGPTLCPLRDDALPSFANHQIFYQTPKMQKARNIINATGFLNVVGDRGFEPKNRPSGPTLYPLRDDALPSSATKQR